ncbi:alpha/beta fold hydrolase [Jonesiaceae bacterium BS-20]|uniref:Alpha/beta fold hydrolase n=1 Tax=Jonesiaceae bacterium BS-20 TaxID=3120821 RepID=A0AAU7DZK6_9MICO
MTTTINTPIIILIAGHWLGAWAWDEVLHHLRIDHAGAIAITLPGLDPADPERATKTLDAQATYILETITHSGSQSAVLVAHSGANAPVSLVMDRHPELVHRVVWVDSGPVATGSVFAPDLPAEVAEVPLPPFDILAQQASLEGLIPEVLERFQDRAVPQPGPVLRGSIALTNDARRAIRTTLICCSMPGAQVLDLAHAGHPMFAEVANFQHLDVVDLPTGHWPMWSRPLDLARTISFEASRAS